MSVSDGGSPGPGYIFTTEPRRRFVCWRKQPMRAIAPNEEKVEWRHPFATEVSADSGSGRLFYWNCVFCGLFVDAKDDPR